MTVKQLTERYPAFTQNSVRWWIFNAEQNGFDQCLIRIGGRVYIDQRAFKLWLDGHRVTPVSGEPNQ